MKLQFDFFCRDVEAQLAFYRALLGLPEAAYCRAPGYRAVHTVDFQFGFRATKDWALGDARAAGHSPGAVHATGCPTLLLDSPAEVDAVAARAADLGGRLVQAPAASGRGHWQAVIADPEQHLFLVACEDLPPPLTQAAC